MRWFETIQQYLCNNVLIYVYVKLLLGLHAQNLWFEITILYYICIGFILVFSISNDKPLIVCLACMYRMAYIRWDCRTMVKNGNRYLKWIINFAKFDCTFFVCSHYWRSEMYHIVNISDEKIHYNFPIEAGSEHIVTKVPRYRDFIVTIYVYNILEPVTKFSKFPRN